MAVEWEATVYVAVPLISIEKWRMHALRLKCASLFVQHIGQNISVTH